MTDETKSMKLKQYFPEIQRAKRELEDQGPQQMFSFENSEIFFDTFILDDFLSTDLYFSTNCLAI